MTDRQGFMNTGRVGMCVEVLVPVATKEVESAGSTGWKS